MKNLIFFLPSFSNYGAGNSTLRLCKILDKKNYQISIISLGKNLQKFKLKKIGCKIFEINSNNVFRSMKLIIPLVNKIYDAKMEKNIFISSKESISLSSSVFTVVVFAFDSNKPKSSSLKMSSIVSFFLDICECFFTFKFSEEH